MATRNDQLIQRARQGQLFVKTPFGVVNVSYTAQVQSPDLRGFIWATEQQLQSCAPLEQAECEEAFSRDFYAITAAWAKANQKTRGLTPAEIRDRQKHSSELCWFQLRQGATVLVNGQTATVTKISRTEKGREARLRIKGGREVVIVIPPIAKRE